jgi:UDP-N-acetyl-D-galactosamine dehydrogenase
MMPAFEVVVGLGYVGLPLAVEFGKKMPTLGLDLSADKVAAGKSFAEAAVFQWYLN